MEKLKKEDLTSRKPRVDALRNREILVTAARQVFAQKGGSASLEEIARSAGVGIGTLYRHFPTREDMIDAVYQAESEQIFNAAKTLSQTHTPAEAMRAWLLQFVDYLEMKQGMTELLKSSKSEPRKLSPASGESLQDVFGGLLKRAQDAGEIQLEGDPMDLLRAIAGVVNMNNGPAKNAAAKAMVNLILAGLKNTQK